MPTILVTGCSSGFGLAIARRFLDHGWTVIATMRTPREEPLPPSDRLRMLALDVTDADSIARAVAAAGRIDILVNNAGVGLLNAVEGGTMAMVREVFETNAVGTIAMTRAVLPQFRARGGGVVVNISSSATLRPLELVAVYAASKAAVNAFSESLALEVAPFGVRVRLVVPGRSADTAFGDNLFARMGMDIPPAYGGFAGEVFARMQQATEGTSPGDVCDAVWRAATDPDCPMRLVAGADAIAWSDAPPEATGW